MHKSDNVCLNHWLQQMYHLGAGWLTGAEALHVWDKGIMRRLLYFLFTLARILKLIYEKNKDNIIVC